MLIMLIMLIIMMLSEFMGHRIVDRLHLSRSLVLYACHATPWIDLLQYLGNQGLDVKSVVPVGGIFMVNNTGADHIEFPSLIFSAGSYVCQSFPSRAIEQGVHAGHIDVSGPLLF